MSKGSLSIYFSTFEILGRARINLCVFLGVFDFRAHFNFFGFYGGSVFVPEFVCLGFGGGLEIGSFFGPT